jgi:hypothetical protein
VAVFIQTDVRHGGVWVDKAYLLQQAAEEGGHSLLWHKLACRVPPGALVTGVRAGYHHLLCFARGTQHSSSSSGGASGSSTSSATSSSSGSGSGSGSGSASTIPDVLLDAGGRTWARGTGAAACAAACRYLMRATRSLTVIDPFCGEGTVLAVANALGLSAVGVELSAKRARKAVALQVALGAAAAGVKHTAQLRKQQQQHQGSRPHAAGSGPQSAPHPARIREHDEQHEPGQPQQQQPQQQQQQQQPPPPPPPQQQQQQPPAAVLERAA